MARPKNNRQSAVEIKRDPSTVLSHLCKLQARQVEERKRRGLRSVPECPTHDIMRAASAVGDT